MQPIPFEGEKMLLALLTPVTCYPLDSGACVFVAYYHFNGSGYSVRSTKECSVRLTAARYYRKAYLF